ncbi:MAG: RNA polymerase sigma factor [Novosphingobium sp.]
MGQVASANGIEKYWDEVAAYLARRLGDNVVAADLTQETYLRAAALPTNTALINPRAWLFATARNLLVDHARRSRVRKGASGGEEELLSLPDDSPDVDQILLAREELDVLKRAVEDLPPRTREVFRLHKFDGKSYAEIAHQLGMAKNTVMVHMVKALGHCRKAVQEYKAMEKMSATNCSTALRRLQQHGPRQKSSD